MELCTSIQKMREVRTQLSISGKPVGLVPTMGALHEGHLQLIKEASREADVVVSIFVNPTQFGPNEDLDRYPRDPDGDLALCEKAGVKAIFMPDPSEMYPSQGQIRFDLGSLSSEMCGTFRPGHFEGVCQVVTKLFHIIQPDLAWFGQKDIQQFLILEKLVNELNFPVGMRSVPTVRENDGLALSSRNRYLSSEERAVAPILYQSLQEIQKAVISRSGHSSQELNLQTSSAGKNEPIHSDISAILNKQRSHLTEAGFRLDYLDIYEKETLQPVTDVHKSESVIIAGAAWLGSTRLIDNIVLS